ncbi:MAG TPA: outer membrane protein assembly factor BamD [Polyangiaceae bacterium]|jgi:hypothetical protein|nr:outer membrane protein assembly factor BamD [Polyangiaceae bacterium]
MKDLTRLLDEQGTDPLEADLLRLAKNEGPSGESRRRILAGLGVAVAAGTVSQSSSAAASSAAASSPSAPKLASRAALKWSITGVAAVGAAVAAFLLLRPHAPKTEPAPQITPPAVFEAAPIAPSVATPSTAEPAPNSDSAQVTKLEDLPTLPDSSATDSSHAAPASSAPSLADEVAAIKSAKSALAAGNAADSLQKLDAYRKNFPHGRLTQEASVVRIEALLKSGNQVAANAAADRFLAAHADSPYAARIHTLIGH